MWWLADPQDLHRVSERISNLYVEKCHVTATTTPSFSSTENAPSAFRPP